MQVSSALESDQFAIIGGGKSRKFRINASASFFKILSDGLYAHKEAAVVRETICNVYDAHVLAGIPDRAAEITLSGTQITFRDFGPGIADEIMDERFCNYGGSTKTLDDSQIGGFGLGCKSPFAVTDHFMVTSFNGGFKRTYALTMGGDESEGEPRIKEMACQPSPETGLLVTVPIGTPVMYNHFEAALRTFLQRSGIKATINGEKIAVRDYSGIEQAGFGLFKQISRDHTRTHVWVLYGKVLYPVTPHEEIRDLLEKLERIARGTGMDLVLHAPPSSIAVQPSREGLGYSDRTLETIKRIGKRALNEITSNLPARKREVFMAQVGKFPRGRFHEALQCFEQKTFEGIPLDRCVGGKDAAARYALVKLGNRDEYMNPKLHRLAADFYREGRRLILRPPSDRWQSSNVPRGVHIYHLQKVVRMVSGVEKPNLQFRIGAGNKLHKASVATSHCNPIATLTIAPSRTSALTTSHGGFFLIADKLTPEQIADIEYKAKMFRFALHYAVSVKANKPRGKIVTAKTVKTDLFTPFKNGGSAGKKGYERYYKLAHPTIETPAAFMPLQSEAIVLLVKPKKCEIGPMQPSVKKTLHVIPANSTDQFYQNWSTDETAIPINAVERDRLVVMGVPRVCEHLVAELRKRVQPKNAECAFTAYIALYSDASSYYGRNDDTRALRFASTMAQQSRRLACAVFMQKYRSSPELDKTFALWRTAREFFAVNVGKKVWLDDGEAALYLDCREQYQQIVRDFEKHQPTEMADFFNRIKNKTLTRDDVAHLNFLSKVLKENRWGDLRPAEQDRFIQMIEDEGKNFVSGKIPKQKAKLKLRHSTIPTPTDEEDDE